MQTKTESSVDGVDFASRGIGKDWTHGCFICGGDPNGCYNNIAAFVRSKESGQVVVGMFEKGAVLDYRSSEPNWVQVKIGACDGHLANLQKLHKLTEEAGQIITKEMIESSMTI